MAPFAHVRFCVENPDHCTRRRVSIRKRSVALTESRMRQLETVQRQVNAAIIPTPDSSGPFGDRWTLNPRRGDCDDYAVTKRARLLELGWPSNALLLTQLSFSQKESHLVLTVMTGSGAFVLDNLEARVVPATAAMRVIEKIQSPANPERWLTPAARLPDSRLALRR